MTAYASIEERREAVRKLAINGVITADIAKRLGLTNDTVRNDLKALGVQAPKKGQIPFAEKYPKETPKVIKLAAKGLILKEIAAEVGLRPDIVSRIAKESGISIRRRGVTHGRVSTYRSGCKCKPCTNVGLHYDRDRRIDRMNRKNKPEHIHGTYGGATNWGCKCDRCTAAVKKHNDAALKTPVEPKRRWVDWTPEEDSAALDYSMTAKEIALKLGRSVASVNARRIVLKQRATAE